MAAKKKRSYSRYQRNVIRRFYENREQIETQRLQEIVTEIYLAQGGSKAERLWARAAEILERTEGLEEAEVKRVLAERDVEGLAAIAGRAFG